MRQTSFAEFHCSLSRALDVMGDWWSPLILRDVHLGLDRFDTLVADLGISRNLLTDRLDRLVRGGVLERELYQEHPPRHRYRLTEAGRELVPVLLALTAWGDRWVAPEAGPPVRVRHADCGRTTVPTVCCSGCGGALTDDNVVVRPGPGGREAPGTALLGKALGR